MDTNSDDQFLAIEATVEANKQEADKKHNETTENIKQLTDTVNKVLKGLTDKTTFRNPLQPRRIQRLLQNLPPRSRLTGGLYHWKKITPKILVACGPSNMRSAHQDFMSSSSR